MRLISLLFLVIICSNCKPEVNLSVGSSQNFHEKLSEQRYQVDLVDPPVVFVGARAMIGGDGNWPFIALLTKDNTIHIDLNIHQRINDKNIMPQRGLGPTFKFKALPGKNEFSPAKKASVLAHVQNEQLLEDRYYEVPPQARDFVEIDKGSINCNLSISSGLRCRVESSLKNEPGPFKTIWHSSDDPIIEMTRLAYGGIYAVTKSGRLLFIERFKTELLPTKFLHADLKFAPNRHGRYFINAPSMKACMKTDKQEIYCAEVSALQSGSQIYGLTNSNQPLLSSVEILPFEVDEVAFGGRHFCFLSSEGEVWCKGDNGCGQITGRHDGKQMIDKLEKVDFLKNKAHQIFAHAGGTCALLIDGNVQCWGLGASVIRTRILPDIAYERSLSWANGFRPWRVCEGGAVNGL